MAQGNVEWYSVHTNRVALRKMAQRNDRFTTVSTRRCFNCKHYFRHTMQIKAFRYHFDWKMSKLIFLICFDIFQSKWHRNALIANTIFGTPMHFYITSIEKCQNRLRISVFLPWRPTLHTKAHTKSNFSPTPVMLKEPLNLNSHWKVSASQKREESSTSDI